MKHTPGSWTNSYGQIMGKAKKSDVSIGIADVKNQDGEINEANARLMAAAPDLLVACKAAQTFLAQWRALADIPPLGALEAAIAKAEETIV